MFDRHSFRKNKSPEHEFLLTSDPVVFLRSAFTHIYYQLLNKNNLIIAYSSSISALKLSGDLN